MQYRFCVLAVGLFTALAARTPSHALELGSERLGVPGTGLQALEHSATPPRGIYAERPWGSHDWSLAGNLAQLLDVPLGSSALERQLFADASDGHLDEWKMIPAALVAGGVDQEGTLRRYLERYESWSRGARAEVIPRQAARQRAAALLNWMHGQVMPQGYQIDATELTKVFDQGQFNCVSATLLFISLATEVGLQATAVELPTHAFCRVTSPQETFDVEPTCRRWFDVIDDPQARAAVQQRIAGAEGKAHGPARLVSPPQLLAVIYYNRGVDLIRRGDDAAAMAANLRALCLDPYSVTAQGNLWVAVNNCALGFCRDQRFAEAADLIRRARQAAPEHAALRANELYIYQQWSAELSNEQRLDEALAVLEQGLERQPDNAVLLSRQEELQRRFKGASARSTSY